MGQAEKDALKRFGRGVAGLAVSGLLAFLTGNPALIFLQPVIQAVAKWLRDKYKIPNVPF
jgi:hypothetical protein